jgi:hypothetical protein
MFVAIFHLIPARYLFLAAISAASTCRLMQRFIYSISICLYLSGAA